MKVIAINGSHRKGKNTATMLNVVLQETANLGAETELVELTDLNIKHCISCNKCLRKPECAIKGDDMAALGEKLMAADGIVLGSPVYWLNVTTLMKNFMDRTRWMHMTENMLADKVGAAVTHAGLRNGGQERCMQVMVGFLLAQGLLMVDGRNQEGMITTVDAAGTMYGGYQDGRMSFLRSVEEDEITMATCREIGRNMIRLINKLK